MKTRKLFILNKTYLKFSKTRKQKNLETLASEKKYSSTLKVYLNYILFTQFFEILVQ